MDLQIIGYDGVNKLSDEEIAQGVSEHINWLQSAVYDMTSYDEDLNHRGYGVEHDCAADDAYDDPDILRSLIGDHLPLQRYSHATFVILFELWVQGHSAIKKVVEDMYPYYCDNSKPRKGTD